MADERLDDREQIAWGGFLLTHDRLWRLMEQGLADVGLSMNEYDVLVALEHAGSAGMRMSDLAERRLMTTGGLTRLADRLQRQALIQRRRSGADGRSLEAVITAQGRSLLRRARRKHLSDVRELFLAQLSNGEIDTLSDIWRRLESSIDEHQADC